MARTNTNSGSGGGAVETLDNGLTLTGSNGQLGGTLIENTSIDIDEFTFGVSGQINTDFSGGLQITDDLFGLGAVVAGLTSADNFDNNALILSGDVSALGIGNTGEVASFMAYLPDTGITSYYLAYGDGLMNSSVDGAGQVITVFQTPTSYAIAGANSALESVGITLEPATGIELLFGTAGALLIDGDEGTLGQALISQGAGAAPIWGTPSVAVDTIYTADGLLTGNRTLDGDEFNLTFNNITDFELEVLGTTVFRGPGDTALSMIGASGYLDFVTGTNTYFRLDAVGNTYDIGDISGANQGTLLTVDDNGETINNVADFGVRDISSAYNSDVNKIRIRVALTASQIQNAFTTPIDIGLPPAGGGYYYMVRSFDVAYTYGTIDFDNATQLLIKDPNAGFHQYENNAIGELSSVITAGTQNPNSESTTANSTLQIETFADSTTGDGTAIVHITVEKVLI